MQLQGSGYGVLSCYLGTVIYHHSSGPASLILGIGEREREVVEGLSHTVYFSVIGTKTSYLNS